MYGVPYELFWHLNPRKMEPFSKSYQKQTDIKNYYAWLNGLYVRYAVVSSLNGDTKYPEQPLGSNKEEEQLSDEDKFNAFIMAFNAQNFNESEEKENEE